MKSKPVVGLKASEGRELAAVPKVALGPLEWLPRNNHVGHVTCGSVLFDDDGVTLPGLTFSIEVRAPIVADSCLYIFTLFKLVQGRKLRAYQLEVAPKEKRTHNGAGGGVYGPHEHWGEELVHPLDLPNVHCGDFQGALVHFCQRCTLVPLNVSSPC